MSKDFKILLLAFALLLGDIRYIANGASGWPLWLCIAGALGMLMFIFQAARNLIKSSS